MSGKDSRKKTKKAGRFSTACKQQPSHVDTCSGIVSLCRPSQAGIFFLLVPWQARASVHPCNQDGVDGVGREGAEERWSRVCRRLWREERCLKKTWKKSHLKNFRALAGSQAELIALTIQLSSEVN